MTKFLTFDLSTFDQNNKLEYSMEVLCVISKINLYYCNISNFNIGIIKKKIFTLLKAFILNENKLMLTYAWYNHNIPLQKYIFQIFA